MKSFSKIELDPGSRALAGRVRWQSMALVVLSLVFGLSVIAFQAGLGATAYETTDSEGRTMGFNDRFSREHYGIILGNVSLQGTPGSMHDLIFVGMHGLALGLLAGVRDGKWMIRFCLLQPLVFPLGLLGIYILPLWVADIAYYRTSDRESFVDVPFVPIMAGGFWLWVVAAIAWRLHRFRKRLRQSPLLGEAPEPARQGG